MRSKDTSLIQAKTGPSPSQARRFLFSTNSGYGHFHPLMPLALALQQAGHSIAFAAHPALQPAIEAVGFTFFPVIAALAADPEYRQLKARLQTMPLDLASELYAYPRLFGGIASRLRIPALVEIARGWQPDMFIREAGEYGAVIAAEHLGMPHGVVAFAASLQGQAIFEREVAASLDPLRQSWGLPPDPLLTVLYRYLHLSYSPPTFSLQEVDGPPSAVSIAVTRAGSSNLPDPLPFSPAATAHFIRPYFFDQSKTRAGANRNAAATDHDEDLPGWVGLLPTDQPTIYITLGTEANMEPGLYPRVLQTIIQGLRSLHANLIVTLGRDKDPADFGPQPANVHIEPYIPHSLLLDRCDLVIIHGGSNSLLAALDRAIPVVVVPLIADQFFNAQVIRRLQLGQVIQTDPEQLTPESVRVAVEEVLVNPIYRHNAARLQTEMHALSGQEYAVELIERVAAGDGTADTNRYG